VPYKLHYGLLTSMIELMVSRREVVVDVDPVAELLVLLLLEVEQLLRRALEVDL